MAIFIRLPRRMHKEVLFVHIAYHFHPEMGYDVNYMARYKPDHCRMVVVTGDNLSLWKTDAEGIRPLDERFTAETGTEIIRLPSFKTGNKKAGVMLRGLNKTLNRLNPDIVFYHGLESVSFGPSLFFQTRKRYVSGDTHTLFSQFRDLSLPGRLYLYGFFRPFIVKRMVKSGRPVFYTALENKRVLTELFGFPEQQVFDNEICTDTRFFYREPVDPAALIPGWRPAKTILYTGKSDHFKQPHLILDALRLVEDRIDFDLNVLIVGPENEAYSAQHYRSPFRNPRIRLVVHPAVPNRELRKYYSLADLAVFPRQNTLSALDAQACGLPVVMEDDETNRKRLAAGGRVYPTGNLEVLAAEMLSLLQDDAARMQLGAAGQAYVKTHFDYSDRLKALQGRLVDDWRRSAKGRQA